MEVPQLKTLFMPLMLSAVLLALPLGCAKTEAPKDDPEKTALSDAAPPADQAVLDEADLAATPPAMTPPAAGTGWTGAVLETMDAGGYTYVQIDTGSETLWAAAPQFAVSVGDVATVPQGMAMNDYHSKSLDRDFPVIYFVGAITTGDAALAPAGDPNFDAAAAMQSAHPSPQVTVAEGEVDFAGLTVPEGGHTVADIFSGKSELSGKKVSVRGKVVKFSPQIMGKNWIHLQDGTDHKGANDLTITTSSMAAKGDTIVASGIVVTDKDFGAGYKYDVIIEEAELTIE
jgi:hypothetical protein